MVQEMERKGEDGKLGKERKCFVKGAALKPCPI
jgi:hypothetical protein